MTLTEMCLLAISITMIATAGALIAIVLHLRVSVRMLEGLVRDSSKSMRRIEDVGAELQSFMHNVNHDYRVVSDVAGRVLHEVARPVRTMALLVRGVRTGVGVLLGPRRAPANLTHERRSLR